MVRPLLLAAVIACAQAAAVRGPGEVVALEDANLQLTVPPGWVRTPRPLEDSRLTLIARGGFSALVLLSTEDGAQSAHELGDTVVDGLGVLASKDKFERSTTQIAGRPAVVIRTDYEEGGKRLHLHVVAFTHQGMGYWVASILQNGDRKAFDDGIAGLLASVRFLGDRPGWKERLAGTVRPQALAGGLLRFDLRQPRWREEDFGSHGYGIDGARYVFAAGGAEIAVEVQRTGLDAAAWQARRRQRHLDDLAKVTVREVPSTQGMPAHAEVRGDSDGQATVIRLHTAVRGGLGIDLAMTASGEHAGDVAGDWNDLLASLRFDDPAQGGAAPAHPLLSPAQGDDPPLPAVAALQAAGGRLAIDDPAVALLADGQRVLRRSGGEWSLQRIDDLSATRLTLADGPVGSGSVAIAPDGGRMAWWDEGVLHIQELPAGTPRRIELPVDAVALAGHRLVACVGGADADLVRSGRRLRRNRLVEIDLPDGAPRDLADFPLARFAHPAVSADGTRVAVACNRDRPRASEAGSNVMLYEAGGRLRALTSGSETIRGLRWSHDGRWLYALSQPGAVADDETRWSVLPAVCWRLDPADGARVDLTRQAVVDRLWPLVDGSLALRFPAFAVGEGQAGIFRFAPEALRAAAAVLPAIPTGDAPARASAVEAAVARHLGGDLDAVVLTAEAMPGLARVFADAVTAATGDRLEITAQGLDRLRQVLGPDGLHLHGDGQRAALIGAGAFYGECLRAIAGGNWRIAPLPLGRWRPGKLGEDPCAVAKAIAPLDAVWAAIATDSLHQLHDDPDELALRGRALLLVHPVGHAPAAIAAESGPRYAQAWRHADAGEVAKAIALLTDEVVARPDCAPLIDETLALCRAAGEAKAADAVRDRAVAAGSTVPAILVAYGDRLAAGDPAKALAAYRTACAAVVPDVAALTALGRLHAQQGRSDLALCCWRRALRVLDDADDDEEESLATAIRDLAKPLLEAAAPAKAAAGSGAAAAEAGKPAVGAAATAPAEAPPANPPPTTIPLVP